MSRVLLSLAAVLCVATSLAAQTRERAPAAPAQMLATPRYLFVLRGEVLQQFDIDTLELRHTRILGPLEDLATAVARRGEIAAAGEPDAEPEPEPREARAAGGRYGLRDQGRARLAERDGELARSIGDALEWLKAHQDEAGNWDADGFMKHDGDGETCGGPGNPTHDIGVTGLAVLAFVADGSTLRSGPYRDVVKRAVAWLRTQQDPDTGLFGTMASHEFIYDHAIATFAMIEAYTVSDYAVLRRNCQLGVDYLERHRNPYGVWRYHPRDGENDTSVTSWCMQALAAAKLVGLEVSPQSIQAVTDWIDTVTDPATGRTGYVDRGGLSSRMVGAHAARYPREENEAMTAAAYWMQLLAGRTAASHPLLATQADLILSKPPRWDPDAGTIDGMAWLYGTLAMYQHGGRHWNQWQRELSAALLPNQRRDGACAGSWDPIGVWGDYGGRVFATAMHALSLQTLYRYSRLVR